MTGCAGTWDTLTSHRFREHPFDTTKKMWSPEDPVAILRADPPRAGDERAAAMRRLQEPIRNKGSQEDQDVILGDPGSRGNERHQPGDASGSGWSPRPVPGSASRGHPDDGIPERSWPGTGRAVAG